MRVTKIIREYVEKRVKEVYGEETQEEKKYNQAKKDFDEALNKANEEIRKIIEEKAKAIPNPYGFNIDITTSTTYSSWRWGGEQPQIYKDSEKAKQERLKKQSDALENIFVTLELGGNKAELEQMLNNLK